MFGKALSFVVFFIVAAFLLYGVYKLTNSDEFFPVFRNSITFRGPLSGLVTGTTTPSSGTSAGVNQQEQEPQRTAPSYSYTPPQNSVQPTAPTQQITPPQGFTVAELSPFYKKVQIYGVTPVSNYSNSPGQFSLSTDYSLEGGVNITGWRLRVNKGGEVMIPQAVEDFDLSRPFVQNDIVLGKGEYLYAYGTKSPMGGYNIRLNQCSGYLNDLYHPVPSFSYSCPSKNRSDYINFSGRCQSFILSLGSCEEPTAQELNQFSTPNDLGCRSYLDTLNYHGCYRKNRYSENFFSNEWRVWLERDMPFDREHDRVLLLDSKGLLVNEYVY